MRGADTRHGEFGRFADHYEHRIAMVGELGDPPPRRSVPSGHPRQVTVARKPGSDRGRTSASSAGRVTHGLHVDDSFLDHVDGLHRRDTARWRSRRPLV